MASDFSSSVEYRDAAKSVRGRCGLCLSEALLHDGHLLPASVYKLSRERASKNPNPIVMTKRGAVPTSRQVSAHFLCGDCEDRLSKGGETYVVAQCARPEGSCAIRDLLNQNDRFSRIRSGPSSTSPTHPPRSTSSCTSPPASSGGRRLRRGRRAVLQRGASFSGRITWRSFAVTYWGSSPSPREHGCLPTCGASKPFSSCPLFR